MLSRDRKAKAARRRFRREASGPILLGVALTSLLLTHQEPMLGGAIEIPPHDVPS